MAKNTDNLDMLSAYADGELPEAEMRQAKEYVDTHREGSALLELYREMTDAVNESAVPAPDALLAGVMHAIENDEAAGTSQVQASPKRKITRKMILTRFMPVAACLVVALLAWGIWGNLFNSQFETANSITGSGGAAPQAAYGDAAADTAYPEEAEPGVAYDHDTAPEAFSEESYDEEALFDTGASQPEPMPSAAPDSIEAEPEPAADSYVFEVEVKIANSSDEMPWELIQNADFSRSALNVETEPIVNYLEKATHWIVIEGEFPQYLDGYDYEIVDSKIGLGPIYVISSSAVAPLLSDLSSSYTVSFRAIANTANAGGTNAAVIYR